MYLQNLFLKIGLTSFWNISAWSFAQNKIVLFTYLNLQNFGYFLWTADQPAFRFFRSTDCIRIYPWRSERFISRIEVWCSRKKIVVIHSSATFWGWTCVHFSERSKALIGCIETHVMGNRSNIFLNPLKSAVINAYNHYNLFLSLVVYVFKIYLNTFLILYTLSLSLSLQSNCFKFASFSKPLHFSSQFFCVNMASSSNPTSSTQRTESMEQYEELFRTLLTPINNLEVLSELI